MTDPDELIEVRGMKLTREDAQQIELDAFLYGNAFVQVVVQPDGAIIYKRIDPTTIQIKT